MQLNLFTDLINALGKVGLKIKEFTNFTKTEREKYRQVMEETCRLIDTTLNMVIIKLGDILSDDDVQFMQEIAKIDNYNDWINAEREFRLCKSLRVAVRETETLTSKVSGAVSTKDWTALLDLMHSTLATEGDVAMYISNRFGELAKTTRNVSNAATETDTIRQNVTLLRESLIKERHELIRQEIEVYSII